MGEARTMVVAKLILLGFEQYRREFKEITSEAKSRFEGAEWISVQKTSIHRIKLYKNVIHQIGEGIDITLSGESLNLEEWPQVKENYSNLIKNREDEELAQTVFNTFFRKSNSFKEGKNVVLSDEYIFLNSMRESLKETNESLVDIYGPASELSDLIPALLLNRFTGPFVDIERDIASIQLAMKTHIPQLQNAKQIQFEMLKSTFFRNKGAYLIGRMSIDSKYFPIAIPIHNNGEGLFVDTIIWNENDLSIIFSFTRSYFMVDCEVPSALVSYLNMLLPNKKTWELYTSLGFYKHGKTEFYRDFLTHLESSEDQFVIADGIRGLVMMVFTLPSYRVVFKIIKDKFSPTKKVTREQVRDAYKLVKTHDRVGRMADTQEFTHIALPKDRFSADLITELQRVASSSITVTDDQIIISHLYTERQMTPMNIYMKGKNDTDLKLLLDEYGNAIKQLAAANIFPGDMLLKNFGVTRHGRVIFYDYDEICYLTEVNFREIPKADYAEDAMSAQPWFSVSPQDVFPEEFINFLFHSPHIKALFCSMHGDLFTVEFWRSLQKNIRNEKVIDVFPYRRNRRFLS